MATTMDKVNTERQQVMASSKSLLSNGLAWRLALATAIGAYGGFPSPPAWWQYVSQFKIVQFLLLWVLVYSSALPGRKDNMEGLIFVTVVTAVIYGLMCFTDLIYYATSELSNIKCEVNDSA